MNTQTSNTEIKVKAPEICCLIRNAELVLLFFNNTRFAFKQRKNVIFDMTATTLLDETFVAMLMSHIKDKSITLGAASRIEPPKNESCAKKLSRLGVYKKIPNSDDGHILDDEQNFTKVTSLIVANSVAKNVVDIASIYLYGKARRLKSLYAVLIELMANTNNHAGGHVGGNYQWWLYYFVCEDEKKLKFIFMDMGVGIFESLPVKQYKKSNPFFILSQQYKAQKFLRQREVLEIFKALAMGKIKSSTGISARGKGLPLICELALSDHFENFMLISNDAYVDIKETDVWPMDQKFNGTLFYFELKESLSDE